jgi:hypothetical protein
MQRRAGQLLPLLRPQHQCSRGLLQQLSSLSGGSSSTSNTSNTSSSTAVAQMKSGLELLQNSIQHEVQSQYIDTKVGTLIWYEGLSLFEAWCVVVAASKVQQAAAAAAAAAGHKVLADMPIFRTRLCTL